MSRVSPSTPGAPDEEELEEEGEEEETLGEEEPELLDVAPDLCNAKSTASASTAHTSTPTCTGRDNWAIPPNFGIRAARVEPRSGAWTCHPASHSSRSPRNTAWTTVSVGNCTCVRVCMSLSAVPPPAASPTIAT